MGDWQLEVAFHWPHNRLALGWEFIDTDEDFDHRTFKLYVFIVTLTIDF